jgi:hypothetical protein
MTQQVAEAPLPAEDGAAPRAGAPWWWLAIHASAVLLVATDPLAGHVPLFSFRVGADGTTSGTVTGYATAALLYGLVWRAAARGGGTSQLLLKVAFSVSATFSVLGLLGAVADDPTSGILLTSAPLAVVHVLIVVSAAAIFFTHTRDLGAGIVSPAAVAVMLAGTVVVGALGAFGSTVLAHHTATPKQAAARTRPLLAEPSLSKVADHVRQRAGWRPWERWTVTASGWASRDALHGSASGSGTAGLPGPEEARQPSWLLLTVSRQQVCLTQDGAGTPVRRAARTACIPAP